MAEFIGVARAEVEGADVGTPTKKQLAAWNERIAVQPLETEELFVVPHTISSTRLDSHGTHMDLSSLRNYRQGVRTGRGLPYMYMHATGTEYAAGEMPHGRVFDGILVPLTDDDRAQDFRDVPEEIKESGPQFAFQLRTQPEPTKLIEYAGMTRIGVVNGRAHEDIIRQIEAGTWTEHSIGFSLNPAIAPDASIVCDICGGNYLSLKDCKHFALVTYDIEMADEGEVDTIQLIATAEIRGAAQNESSMVWRGSLPAAMVERAQALYSAGHLDEKQATMLEYIHETRILPRRTFGLIAEPVVSATPAETTAIGSQKQNEQSPSRSTEDTVDRDQVAALLSDEDLAVQLDLYVEDGDWVAAAIRVVQEARRADIESLEEERNQAQEQISFVRRELGLDDDEALIDGLRRLRALADTGQEVRGNLVDEYVRQLVRTGAKFDEEEERALTKNWEIDQLERKIAQTKALADTHVSAGRVSEPAIVGKADQNGQLVADPSLYT